MATQADDLREALDTLPFGDLRVWSGPVADADGERARPIHATKVAAEGPSDAFEAVAQEIAGNFDRDTGPDGSYPVTFDWTAPNGDQWASDAMASLSESQESLVAEFNDGSSHQLIADLARYAAEAEPLDVGVKLLEPITDTELAGVEKILAVLWKAVDDESLSEVQQKQIIALAEVIKTAQTEAEPDVTLRWKVIGAVRGVVRYLRKDLIRDVAVIEEIVEQAQRIGWIELANDIASNLPL